MRSLVNLCAWNIIFNFEDLISISKDLSQTFYIWKNFSALSFSKIPQSDEILKTLLIQSRLKKEHLSLFSSKYCSLNSCGFLMNMEVDRTSLQFICDKPLEEMCVANISGINLSEMIECLSVQSQVRLNALSVKGISLDLSSIKSLDVFVNLNSLSLRQTELDNKGLETLVHSIARISSLNICNTKVRDIECLRKWKECLTDLYIGNLFLKESCISTLSVLYNLSTLDISRDFLNPLRPQSTETLLSPEFLPNLKDLDMSGNIFQLTSNELRQLIENHPKLEFVGLANWKYSGGVIPLLAQQNQNIKFVSTETLEMTLNLLQRYCERDMPKFINLGLRSIDQDDIPYNQLKDVVKTLILVLQRCQLYEEIYLTMMLLHEIIIYANEENNRDMLISIHSLSGMIVFWIFYTLTYAKEREILVTDAEHVLENLKATSRCFKILVNFMQLAKFCENHWAYVMASDTMLTWLQERNSIKIGSDEGIMCFLLKCIARSNLKKNEIDELISDDASNVLEYLKHGNTPTDNICNRVFQVIYLLLNGNQDATKVFLHFGGLKIFRKLFEKIDLEECSSKEQNIKVYGILAIIALFVRDSTYKSMFLEDTYLNMMVNLMGRCSLTTYTFASEVICHLTCTPDAAWCNLKFNKIDVINVMWNSVWLRNIGDWSHNVYTFFQSFQDIICHPNCRLDVMHWVFWAIDRIICKDDNYYYKILYDCEKLMRCLLYFGFLPDSEVNEVTSKSFFKPFTIPRQAHLKSPWERLREEINREVWSETGTRTNGIAIFNNNPKVKNQVEEEEKRNDPKNDDEYTAQAEIEPIKYRIKHINEMRVLAKTIIDQPDYDEYDYYYDYGDDCEWPSDVSG